MEKDVIEKGKIDIQTDTDTIVGLENRVILYNDNWHTFDDVILQLIKATGCSFDKARSHAFEVHVKGNSMVFSGSMKNCLKVSSILEEIALNTQIVS